LPLPGAPAVSLSVTGATLVLASPPFGINPSGGFTTGLAAATVASGDVSFNDPLTQTTYTTSIAGTTNSQPFNLSGTVTQVPGGYDASLVFTGLDLAVTQTTTNIVGSFTLTGSLTLSYRALNPDTGTISLSTGGAQTLHVSTGGPHGGDWYWVLASGSGTSPGIGVPGGFTLPLSYDPWFDFSVVAFNTTFLQNTQGILDGAGTATAQVVLPAGLSPSLAGAQFHFAYATAANSPTAASVTSVSGPVSLTLVP